MDKKRLILIFICIFVFGIGIALITKFSNWQTAVGIVFVLWGLNMDNQNKSYRK